MFETSGLTKWGLYSLLALINIQKSDEILQFDGRYVLYSIILLRGGVMAPDWWTIVGNLEDRQGHAL